MYPRLPTLARNGALAAAVIAGILAAQTAFQTAAERPAPQGVAASSAQPAPAAPSDGRGLLEQAIVAIESRQSAAAKIYYRFELLGYPQMVGSGAYLEQRSETAQLFRHDAKLQLDDGVVTLLQVFDGQNLWTYDDLDGEKLTRVDVIQVAQSLRAKKELPQVGEIGKWPGLGGLPRLLRGLNSAFDFEVAEEAAFTLTDGGRQREMPVWRLRGNWKPDLLAQLLPDQAEDIQQGKPVRLEKLPEHLPDHVMVYLGQDDLFPYQIDYRRHQPKRLWERSPPESKSLVIIQFPEVSLDVAIPPGEFTYRPGSLAPTDGTAAFIGNLEKAMK